MLKEKIKEIKKTITFILDGKEVTTSDDETIWQIAKKSDGSICSRTSTGK